jgi:hypothetical protein
VQSRERRFSHPVVSCMPDNAPALAPRRSENKTRRRYLNWIVY